MLLESAAVLFSWKTGVFFDLWGVFMTGFTVLGAKMSSLKNREMDIIFGKKCQLKKKGSLQDR